VHRDRRQERPEISGSERLQARGLEARAKRPLFAICAGHRGREALSDAPIALLDRSVSAVFEHDFGLVVDADTNVVEPLLQRHAWNDRVVSG
jgi:hypothetical protein